MKCSRVRVLNECDTHSVSVEKRLLYQLLHAVTNRGLWHYLYRPGNEFWYISTWHISHKYGHSDSMGFANFEGGESSKMRSK